MSHKNYQTLTSFLVLFTGSILALTSFNIYILTAGLLLSLIYGYINYKNQMLYVIKFSVWIIFGFVLSQSFFYWGFYSGQKTNIIFWVIRPNYNSVIDFLTEDKGIAITYQGITWGLISSAKLLLTLFLAFSFSKNLSPTSVIKIFKKIGIPTTIALGAVMTFRLLPEMIDMTKTIYSVSKVRKPKNIKSFYKPYILLKALIYSSVKKAFVTSLALETKGVPSFTLECEPSKKPYYRLVDLLFLALLASLIVLNFFPYF